MFDHVEYLKLDLYPRELIEGELDRSESFELFPGLQVPVVSRADLSCAKLVWISKGSHKSRRDLRQLFAASTDEEREQVRSFAAERGLSGELAEILAQPDEIG